MVEALGQGRHRVIGLARLVEVVELPHEQLAQPLALAALPRAAVPIQHPVSFHRLPAPLTGKRLANREPEYQPPGRCLRQMRQMQEPLDQQDRAVVVVQEPRDKRPQDLGLLWFGTEVCLADDQFPADPVEFSLRVGPRVCLGLRGLRVEVERDRRLEARKRWMREAGQSPPVELVGLLEQSPQRVARMGARIGKQFVLGLAAVASPQRDMGSPYYPGQNIR